MNKVYTSDEILAADDLYHLQDEISFRYQLTKDELQWLKFVAGRYSIADYIMENSVSTDDEQSLIVTIIPDWLSEALEDDGMAPKVVCLSEDSAFHKICFWVYRETERGGFWP